MEKLNLTQKWDKVFPKSDKVDLPGLFYRADKLSRNCFLCPAQEDCNWPEEKKNLEIRL